MPSRQVEPVPIKRAMENPLYRATHNATGALAGRNATNKGMFSDNTSCL